ncbi:MAG: pseudaminic acid synthase [Patescibacteria group bacterium]|jgi:pseudaminic acid synthase
MDKIKIKTPQGIRLIGPGESAFIIAEMSGNHNQSYQNCLKIIDAALSAGADAIKLQTYTADTLTINCVNRYFQITKQKNWSGQTLYDLYKKAYTPWDWQAKLKNYAEKKGLFFFSTPFDKTAVDFLEKMKVQIYKIASFEIGDFPLLKRVGQTKKPVIISRGMATAKEVDYALKTLKKYGCPQVAILHCVSAYPARSEEMNLLTIPDLTKKFKVITGLSDHSLGITAAITSIALGAKIIEKHLTLKHSDGGPDAAFSLEPQEFKDMVEGVRLAEKSLGQPFYNKTAGEKNSIIFKKSLFIVKDIKKGEKITEKNMRSIRPGYGLPPKNYELVLGKKIKNHYPAGTPLSWSKLNK